MRSLSSLKFPPQSVAHAATINIDSSTTSAVNITATGDESIAIPTNGTDGATVQLTILASAASRIITFNASFQRLTGITSSYSVPSGKILRVSLRCTTITGSAVWIVEAAGVTQ
jgi:hypothetical protein